MTCFSANYFKLRKFMEDLVQVSAIVSRSQQAVTTSRLTQIEAYANITSYYILQFICNLQFYQNLVVLCFQMFHESTNLVCYSQKHFGIMGLSSFFYMYHHTQTSSSLLIDSGNAAVKDEYSLTPKNNGCVCRINYDQNTTHEEMTR